MTTIAQQAHKTVLCDIVNLTGFPFTTALIPTIASFVLYIVAGHEEPADFQGLRLQESHFFRVGCGIIAHPD